MWVARSVVVIALGVVAGCGGVARSDDADGAARSTTAAGSDTAAVEPLAAGGPSRATGAPERPVVPPAVDAEPTAVVELVASPRRPQLAPQYDAVWVLVPDWFGDPATCPVAGRAAVVDRANQMAWLCGDGAIVREFPVTTAVSQPDPGTYPVYAKDRYASSTISGSYSEMTHFVAFTHGKYQGARIAFHSVPTYRDGSFVQPLESVGTAEQFGASAGCIRVLPDDAVAIWDWLGEGDPVSVIS